MARDRCESCDGPGSLKRHMIGMGYKSRVVWLCPVCASPVVELWTRTSPSRVGRRASMKAMLAEVDDRGRVRPVKGRKPAP